jgi:hypothetical protein
MAYPRVLLLCLFAIGCASQSATTAPKLSQSDAQLFLPVMEVLSARAAKSEFGRELIVADQTLATDWRIGADHSDELQSLASGVALRNRTAWRVPPVPWPRNVRQVSSARLSRLLRGRAAWQRFRREFPNAYGVVRFSAPAHNATRDRAAVGIDVSCGFLCGYGELFVLRNHGGAWVVDDSIALWEN